MSMNVSLRTIAKPCMEICALTRLEATHATAERKDLTWVLLDPFVKASTF